MRLGGLEAGGTKMVCAVADENGKVLHRESFPTTTPEETIPKLVTYFREHPVEALGVGSFGPVDLHADSPLYGHITCTPKPGWAYTDLYHPFTEGLGIPVGFDTDVNVAALGEVRFGAAKGLSSAIYMTVGTGIGMGVYVNGGLLHGLVHPEAGHIRMVRNSGDTYPCNCAFHTDCLEGMAAGPAVAKRYGTDRTALAVNEEFLTFESDYLAQAVWNCILCYSPEKIILWGGVMHQESLFPRIREKVKAMSGDYIKSPVFDALEDYIVPPALGDDPGIIGATQLGLDAYQKRRA